MKKIIFLLIPVLSFQFSFSQPAEQLSGTTIGFSAGVNHLFNTPDDYSLDPGNNALVVQSLSGTSLVISSVITIKFGKVSTQTQGTGAARKTVITRSGDVLHANLAANNGDPKEEKAKWYEKIAFNLGINLADISGGNISFNKSIDGGVGFGYFVNSNIQLGAFFDIMRIRQMRNYIVTKYEGQKIPNGTDFFNALDYNNNNLFYNKTFTGASFKIIIAVNPKKTNP
jgi:hypothetical protein